MSPLHNRTDQYLDDLLNDPFATEPEGMDGDDAEIMHQLVEIYRADSLPMSAKQHIWQTAYADALSNKVPVTSVHRGWAGKWVAAILVLVVVAIGFVSVPLSQLNFASEDQTAIPQEITLITPTVAYAVADETTPVAVVTATASKVTPRLLSAVPEISPAFGFEYGGYVMEASTSVLDMMQEIDMKWIAFSITYIPDMDTDGISEQIHIAHQNDYKVFVSIAGTPITENPKSYLQGYIDYVAQVAESGADAIEIWKEANLDRSWVQSEAVDTYAILLTETSQAIRDSNSQTMVISGAPAPTGAESAFPGRVMDDDNFMTQLKESGALDYVDCVGMHYNEGTVSPLAHTGDSRDDDYRRYLPEMLRTYRALVDAEIPICVTEIGYFNAEGLASVPQFFEWGSHITTRDQQEWLAQAMEWLSLQLDVPLAMIWHIDLESEDTFPEVYRGYALLR